MNAQRQTAKPVSAQSVQRTPQEEWLPHAASENPVVSLQGIIGNRAVQQLLSQGTQPHTDSALQQKSLLQRYGEDWLDQAGEAVSGVVGSVRDTANSAIDWTVDKAAGAAQGVGEAVSGVVGSVRDTTNSAIDWATGKAGEAAQWVGENAGSAVNETTEDEEEQ